MASSSLHRLALVRFPGVGGLDLAQGDQSQLVGTGSPYGGNARDVGHFGLEEGLMSAPFLSLKAELAGLQGVKDPPFSVMCPPHLCFQEVPVFRCSVCLSSRNWPHTSDLAVTQCLLSVECSPRHCSRHLGCNVGQSWQSLYSHGIKIRA